MGMGARVRVGFRDSAGVQSGQNFPWAALVPMECQAPEGGTFGNYLLAGGLGGEGGEG